MVLREFKVFQDQLEAPEHQDLVDCQELLVLLDNLD
jgi:hypothetical protein